jgi:predicted PurR-regulated permease PerM
LKHKAPPTQNREDFQLQCGRRATSRSKSDAISAYLLTITTIVNAFVGAATGVVTWSTGVGDPVLQGTIAFILNDAPILRPAAATVLFAGSA